MHYQQTACRIIDLLVQGDAVDDPLLNSVRRACHDRRWTEVNEVIHAWDDGKKAAQAESLLWSSEAWEAARDIVRGSYFLADHNTKDALREFVKAENRKLEDESHVNLVSLVASGLTYKIERTATDRARAIVVLSRAQRVASRWARRSDTEAERTQQRLYETLFRNLGASIAELQDASLPRLIPVVQATAGVLRYVPGDDSAIETSYLAVDEDTYRLLSYRNRAEMSYKIRSESEYFLVDVDGQSMFGERARIRNGDKLLAEVNPDWHSAGSDVVVVKERETDTKPRVKFVKLDERTITLRSANERFGPEVYTRASPELDMLGIIKAILEER